MADAEEQNDYLNATDDDDAADDAAESAAPPREEVPVEAPRTIGGFVVDDEDEDEEYTPEFTNQQPNDTTAVEETDDLDQGLTNGVRLEEEEEVPTSNDLPITLDPSSSSPSKQEQDEPAADDGGQTESAASYDPAVPTTNGASAEHSEHATVVEPAQSPSSSVQATTLAGDDFTSSVPKARLAHDHVGMLEDRIREDPRGDLDAWVSLIGEHRRRNKLDKAREVYDRFFEVFPTAAEQWVAYAEMELEISDWAKVENIFNRSLLNVLNLQLWSTYLNYVRRRNNVTTDKTGQARKTVTETYEFVLSTIGQDIDAGQIWQDYVQFVRSSPEQIGGTTWQDQQKMDTLRKVYQRAVCIPTQAVNTLWKEYDAFEMSVNKATGRKFLQEKSPSYIEARSAVTAIQNLTRGLKRTTMPRLPPVPGFEGDVEYLRQVDIWKQLIEWEKTDPLVIKDEDENTYKSRILYAYRQAVMALRFWPEMWYDAAEFCFSNGLEEEGNNFLTSGIAANPESCLLAFKQADRIESSTTKGQTDESIVQRGASVRAPYDKVLDALYDLCAKIKEREKATEARLRENAQNLEQPPDETQDGEDEENTNTNTTNALEAQVEAVKKGFASQLKLLGKTISFAWIALMRAMRRVQGKGGLNQPIGGSRQIFGDGRKRGRLTSDFYIANALIEHYCYQDAVATKVFDRGLKLFQDDDRIALEYIKHLININDTINARSVFETTVNRFAQTPALLPKAKPLYAFFHDFESRYGELSQVTKLESRMRELFPEDPQLRLFALRFAESDFDPLSVLPVISPVTQARPKGLTAPVASIENATSVQNSPRPSISTALNISQTTLSPKRPLDDSDNESTQPRKMRRSESPLSLKGAAGRRLDAKRSQLRQELHHNGSSTPTPMPAYLPPAVPSAPQLPPELHRLLSTIPRAESYHATAFNPQRMVDLLRGIDLSRAQLSRQNPQHMPMPQLPSQYPYQHNPSYAYPR